MACGMTTGFAQLLTLRFVVNATSSDDAAIPDRLTFFILDDFGTPIPTLAPLADYFFGADLGSGGPIVDAHGSDDTRNLTVGGPVSTTAELWMSGVSAGRDPSGLTVPPCRPLP